MRRIVTHREQAEAAAVLRELYRLSRVHLSSMTDDEYRAHARRVQHLLRSVPREHHTTAMHAGPENGWTAKRADQHRQILRDAWQELAERVPRNRHGLIFGGLPGSGKSTVFDNHLQIDGIGPASGNFARIDPDYFKEQLAKRGMTPQIEGLSPMETAPLIHEESSYLAQQLAGKAYAMGANVAWDGTLRHPNSGSDRLSDLQQHGYTAHGAFVDVALPTSYARATQRHRQAQDALRAGTADGPLLGGRVVPTDFIASSRPNSARYQSVNRENFEAIRPQLATAQAWDNTGAMPRRIY